MKLRRWIVRLRLAAAFALIGFAAQAVEAPDKPAHYAPSETILILGAVPQEIPPFIEAMKDAQKKSLWGVPYWEGHIEGKPAVVALTGVGKASTGVVTTLFIERFKPRAVLMSGTGARVNQQLRTGDVIVPTILYEHDYGSLTRHDMVYAPFKSPDNGAPLENAFSPPASLLAAADKAFATYKAPRVTANASTYEVTARRGIVASSDLFGVTQARIDTLRTTFKADIMEMESAAFMHACVLLGAPCIVVRGGSNVAQETPNDDYLRLGPIAARQAALFSLHLLKYL
jgi:adenosylhomocysteine nucleosidase